MRVPKQSFCVLCESSAHLRQPYSFTCQRVGRENEKFNNLLNILNHFNELSYSDIKEKIDILKILETDSKREWNPFLTFMEDHSLKDNSPTQRIEPTVFYFRFILQSIDDLHFYRLTGQFRNRV